MAGRWSKCRYRLVRLFIGTVCGDAWAGDRSCSRLLFIRWPASKRRHPHTFCSSARGSYSCNAASVRVMHHAPPRCCYVADRLRANSSPSPLLPLQRVGFVNNPSCARSAPPRHFYPFTSASSARYERFIIGEVSAGIKFDGDRDR